MEMVVCMFNPRTLHVVYSLAKLQDSLKNGLIATSTIEKTRMSRFNARSSVSSIIKPNSTTMTPVRT